MSETPEVPVTDAQLIAELDNMAHEHDERVMPFDRSGAPAGITRQQRRFQERQSQKMKEQEIKRQQEMRKMFKKPVERGEFQNTVYNLLGGLEKMAAEFKKLSIRHEALLRAAISTGLLSAEEFERQAKAQNDFNTFVDEISDRHEPLPLQETLQKVRDYNNDETNEIKVLWQHFDLAPRLRNEKSLTLEEKLMIAAEFEMPEAFIQGLRELGEFGEQTPDFPFENFDPAVE